jgi:hypothetical protein
LVSVIKFDIIRSHSLPLIPQFSNFASNLSCFTQLNAFVRSQNSPQTYGLLSELLKCCLLTLSLINPVLRFPAVFHSFILLKSPFLRSSRPLPSKLLNNIYHTLHPPKTSAEVKVVHPVVRTYYCLSRGYWLKSTSPNGALLLVERCLFSCIQFLHHVLEFRDRTLERQINGYFF